MAAQVVPIAAPDHPVRTDFERLPHRALWISIGQRRHGPHNFSLALVRRLVALLDRLRLADMRWEASGAAEPIDYCIVRSDHPDYFSVGGDLAHFRACIAAGDWQALDDYAMLCLDIAYRWAADVSRHATTIALVQGRALGGGFEMALGADYIIAEEQAEFGFPEILFGLFPCSGGMSFLGRRVGVHRAERMLGDGRIYSAAELRDMGVIDEVCARGRGEDAVRAFIGVHAGRRRARLALQRARHRMCPLSREEMVQVVADWVATARNLTDLEFRVMDTLARLQGAAPASRPQR